MRRLYGAGILGLVIALAGVGSVAADDGSTTTPDSPVPTGTKTTTAPEGPTPEPDWPSATPTAAASSGEAAASAHPSTAGEEASVDQAPEQLVQDAQEVAPEAAVASAAPSVGASSAGTKVVNAPTYVWGRVIAGEGPATVFTQVWVNGGWSQSQSGGTGSDGSYVLELTYGRNAAGLYRYRVGAVLVSGDTVFSPEFTLTRTPVLSASSAGTKPVGAVTYVWGSVVGEGGRPVYTEALVNGRWSRSQTGKTLADGRFTLPLTYGSNVPGQYRYRVTTQSTVGTFSSAEFVLTRTGWQATIRPTQANEVSYSYQAGCPVGPDQLSTITMTYRAYDGSVRTGDLIVRRDIAASVRDAFKAAFDGGFQIGQMRNPDQWQADDMAMMAANNSSAFNCRKVVGNPYRVSPHSYGGAVDINPAQNPYRVGGRWYPNATYATNRPRGVVGMHYADGPMVKAMVARGFEWYSGWDWHHFQK